MPHQPVIKQAFEAVFCDRCGRQYAVKKGDRSKFKCTRSGCAEASAPASKEKPRGDVQGQ